MRNEEQAKRLADEMERARSIGGVLRNVIKSIPWFGLPFLVMWGSGVAVEDAARFAVAPWACAGVTLAALTIAGAMVAMIFAPKGGVE